ncbi:hypothetical protein D3C87_2084190 [compost metagenome]
MQLQVDAVHQPQRFERVFGQFTAQAAFDLIAELVDTRGNEGMIEFIVTVHVVSVPQAAKFGPARPL